MIRKTVTESYLNKQTDIDCDVINSDYGQYFIRLTEDRTIQTTDGQLLVLKDSIILPVQDAEGYNVMLLVTDDKIYTTDVDAGLFFYCNWLDMTSDCWPTLSTDLSSVSKEIIQLADEAKQSILKREEAIQYFKLHRRLWSAQLNGLKLLAVEDPSIANNTELKTSTDICSSWISHYTELINN